MLNLLKDSLTMEFFLNASLNSANSVTKKYLGIKGKGLEPATSCIRDQDATTGSVD